MSGVALLGVAFSGLLAGTFIGVVGVGGVLLTPLLLALTDIDVHTAMAVASFSFLFTGVSGSVMYSSLGSVPWSQALWLGAGVIPTALLGARVNALLPTSVLILLLALLLAIAGVNALRPVRADEHSMAGIAREKLLALGLGVGFGSALTGTGGPILLVPLLLLFGVAPLTAIGTAQVIQLPIAVFATLGYALYGNLDLVIGTLLGVSQALAVLLGARLAHALPTTQLRRAVAFALIAAACLLAIRTFTS